MSRDPVHKRRRPIDPRWWIALALIAPAILIIMVMKL